MVTLAASKNSSVARQETQTESPFVLIVESHDDSRFMLRTLLEVWSYRVADVKSGEQALALADETLPDVILMDLTLAQMDGLETMRRLREFDCLREVPIVFLSGHAQPAIRADALARGGNEFLVKPIDIDKLQHCLDKYAKKNRGSVQRVFGGIY